jgi:hypothetical protein
MLNVDQMYLVGHQNCGNYIIGTDDRAVSIRYREAKKFQV